MKQIEFIGVDGCPGGWFAVGFDIDGEFEIRVFDDFARLVSHYSTASLILVDIPIGLPEDTKRRICDVEARKYLVKRTSSLFPTPTVREVHPEVCFWALNNRQPMADSKKTKDGIKQRLDVLKRHESRTVAIVHEACSNFRPKKLRRMTFSTLLWPLSRHAVHAVPCKAYLRVLKRTLRGYLWRWCSYPYEGDKQT